MRRAPPPKARSARSARRRRCASSGGRRGTAATGRGRGRSASAPAPGARASAAGRRRGTARSAGRGPRRPPPPADRPMLRRRRSRARPRSRPVRAPAAVPSPDIHALDPASGRHDAARLQHIARIRARDRREVDDPGVRRMQPGDPTRVGLERFDARASIRRRPGTPLALPRRSSSSSRSSSAGSVATITFPQASLEISCSSQYSYSSRAPSTHSRAFSEPGV